MADEAIEGLGIIPGDTVVDATVGGGAHAERIIERLLPGGVLVGIDCDGDALARAQGRLERFQGAFRSFRENFRNIDAVLRQAGIEAIDGALFDIGVSSFQMEDPGRGFGFRVAGPLDMRMDDRGRLTAASVVNTFAEKDLADIIFQYGEERFSRSIARSIVREREKTPIETTDQLSRVVLRSVGARYRAQKIHPATRTFQAIRIVVNDELQALEEGIRKTVTYLSKGSRIAVISFHSLEDRIVKNMFREYAKGGVMSVITKKPLRPSYEEIRRNPRARSARLRIAEKAG